MARLLYMVLLRLHPRGFRERFGEEMLSIYDEAARKESHAAMLWDGLVSLLRQLLLRPKRHEQPEVVAADAGALMFQTFPSSAPRRSALVQGMLLAMALLVLMNVAMSRGGSTAAKFLIGAKYPRSNVLPFDRSSVAESQPTTQIMVSSAELDPIYRLAGSYFQIIPVLTALDANGDRDISTWEMMTAVSPLRRLDTSGDGKLDAVECGFFLGKGATLEPPMNLIARKQFMKSSPVLAALDADANAEISAEEIQAGPAALKAVDANRDGVLTPVEVLPGSAKGRR